MSLKTFDLEILNKTSPVNILIMGRGGCGKSTLLNQIERCSIHKPVRLETQSSNDNSKKRSSILLTSHDVTPQTADQQIHWLEFGKTGNVSCAFCYISVSRLPRCIIDSFDYVFLFKETNDFIKKRYFNDFGCEITVQTEFEKLLTEATTEDYSCLVVNKNTGEMFKYKTKTVDIVKQKKGWWDWMFGQ